MPERVVEARVLLVLALFLTPSAVAWDQARGGPGRDVVAALPEGPLDVVTHFRIRGEPGGGALYNARAFDTSRGWMQYVVDGEGCRAVVFPDPRSSANEEIPVADCEDRATNILAYDRLNETIFVCQTGPADFDVLQALDAQTMELRWSLAPTAFGALAETSGTIAGFWACMGGALDPETRQLVVPFGQYRGLRDGDYQDHRVVSVDADTGALQWSNIVPQQLPGGTTIAAARNLHPQAATITSNGVIVTGREACDVCRTENVFPMNAFAAWFTREGSFRGYYSAKMPDLLATEDTPADRVRAGSEYAVANGPTGLLALGGRVLMINPEFATPVAERPVVSVEPPTTFLIWPSPILVDDVAVVPLPHSVSGYSSSTLLHMWSWGEDLDWTIADAIGTVTGEVLVLISSRTDSTPWIVRLDGRTGRELDRLALPLLPEATSDGSWYADFAALSDGHLLIVDNILQVAVLGSADPEIAPSATFSDLYPPVGTALSIALPSGEGAESYRVNWGDGAADEGAPGATLRHVYRERGATEARLTAFYPDGRTATSTTTIRVGEAPPPELTTLQKAFAPENQNLTFGILGIVITILGAAYTVGRHRRRLQRLERELAAVEEIRMLSVQDPRGAVLALKSYRDHLPDELARRRIDDSQYQILDVRSARLLRVLRTRMFSPFDARLSQRYHRLLDAAFEDAIIQPSERTTLVNALSEEQNVGAAEREAIVGILNDFTSARADLP